MEGFFLPRHPTRLQLGGSFIHIMPQSVGPAKRPKLALDQQKPKKHPPPPQKKKKNENFASSNPHPPHSRACDRYNKFPPHPRDFDSKFPSALLDIKTGELLWHALAGYWRDPLANTGEPFRLNTGRTGSTGELLWRDTGWGRGVVASQTRIPT